jgi:hypothetical protein
MSNVLEFWLQFPTFSPSADSIGPLPPNWRPSSKGQTVSRAAAAAPWDEFVAVLFNLLVLSREWMGMGVAGIIIDSS